VELSGGVADELCSGGLVMLGVWVDEVWFSVSVGWAGLWVWAVMLFVLVFDNCMAMSGGVSWCSQWVGIWWGGLYFNVLVGVCGL
jgi:hypothetical protein